MDFTIYKNFWLKKDFRRRDLVTHKFNSVLEISIDFLKQNKIDLIIFDFDETLADFHAVSLDTKVETFLETLQQEGIKIGIFSNCSTERNEILKKIFSSKNIYSVNRSDKPNPAGFIEVANHYNFALDRAAMVGDRVATDLYGSYLAGIKLRILVKPFSKVFGGRKAGLSDILIKKLENTFQI